MSPQHRPSQTGCVPLLKSDLPRAIHLNLHQILSIQRTVRRVCGWYCTQIGTKTKVFAC